MKKLHSHLPNKTGIYFLKDKKGSPLYIGKAADLKNRIRSYFTLLSSLAPKTRRLIEETDKVDYFLVDSEFEALLLEAKLIKQYQPKYNVRLKDDKRFPSIGITTEEKYPRVYYTRKRKETKEENVLFFGPFPNPATVKRVLRLLRKIFPFRSCQRMPQKPCLYYYLKLCPGVCFHPPELLKGYRKSILQLIKLLKGEKKLLINQLKSKMKKEAGAKNFELAAKVKKKIEAIEYITQPRVGFEFLLDFDPKRYQKEKKELEDLLKIKKIKRIEGYDISNIGGKWATGSMVAFVDGSPAKSDYRHFKIRSTDSPDDPGMIKEIISRRLKHPKWQYPDLIVVDGGKGQLRVAIETLSRFKIKIPVVALVKRKEEIIAPKGKSSPSAKIPSESKFKTIKLPKTSPALQLIQRVRDEAHRFAQSYHQKLRLKVI